MDALLLRSLQNYVLGMFGPVQWHEICTRADQPSQTYEPMLRYDPGTADRVAEIVSRVLGRPVEAVWEDVGTYLVTSPNREGIRRLLRFGGVSFSDFLHSLEELPARAKLALPNLDPPEVILDEVGPDRFELRCRSHIRGVQRVLIGVLTAMADDYGALCLIETGADDRIAIVVLDTRHATARAFELALPEA